MLSIDKNSFKRDYENKFVQLHGKELKEGTNQQKYEALGSLVKDILQCFWSALPSKSIIYSFSPLSIL